LDTPVRRTISPVPSPSAASSTILARRASPDRIDGDLTHEASTSRSRGGTSTLTVNGISHRPGTITGRQDISLTRHYVVVFGITRALGRRELSALEPFDLVLLIVIGDLIQSG
jgi:hypothetical protein